MRRSFRQAIIRPDYSRPTYIGNNNNGVGTTCTYLVIAACGCYSQLVYSVQNTSTVLRTGYRVFVR